MVSIIVPVYNVKKYLPKCVDSLVNQSFKDIEIILVDDGSTDGSGDVCDQYTVIDKRVKVIHQENSGQGSARNRGLDIAKGEWIGFVDADDWLDEDYYEKMVTSAKENDADMACCDRRVFDEDDKMIYEVDIVEGDKYSIGDKEEYFYKYFFKYTPSSCNKLYKSEILKEIRKDHNFPVIMLTAKTASMEKINGLTLGADDYIEKPFEPLELMARVKAQLRRFIRYNDGSGQSSEDTLEIAGLVLNRNTHQCLYGEEEVTLTPLEFSILWILTKNKGKVISSENLFEQVWKEKYFKNNNNTVMVHIRHLREKLGEVMGHKELIKTVWGVGYKVEE